MIDGFGYSKPPLLGKKGEKEYQWRNRLIYDYWFNRIMELATNAYEWKNLPDTVDERFIEMGLFLKGDMVYFNDEVLGNLCLNVTVGGKFDIYNIPTKRHAYAVNGYQKDLTAEDSVIIYNNYLRSPSVYIADIYARRLTDIDRTIEVNVSAQKTPVLLHGSEEMRLTLKNAYAQYTGNSPVIIADRDFDLKNIQVLKTDAPMVYSSLNTLKQDVWSECLTALGIEASPQKKERLVTEEVSMNLGSVYAQRYTGLNARRSAAEKINAMFGTNIEVGYRQNISVPDVIGTSTTSEELQMEEGELFGKVHDRDT